MTNFSLSRIPRSAGLLAALALGPFVVAAGCNVYGDAPGGQAGQAGQGGSSAGVGGNGATAGNQEFGAQNAGGAAGSEDGGTAGGGTNAGNGGGGSSGENGGTAGTAGASGGGGTGGTSGGGGTGGMNGVTEVIDDMEDDDAQISISGGRNGFWYDGGDGTAGGTIEPSGAFTMTMLSGDRSSYAARLKATGFKTWGSVMGFNFVEFQGVKVYDASAYCGIQFWGKAASAVTVRFRVPDVDTHPVGMICNDTDKLCYDHFGVSAGFTTDWKLFNVQFTQLMQNGTGYHPAGGFKPSQIVATEWALPVNASKAYEIWIDDVAFSKCK